MYIYYRDAVDVKLTFVVLHLIVLFVSMLCTLIQLNADCFLLYRVSIQHVNFHRPFRLKISEHLSSAADETSTDEDNVRVYPISSEGGYVIYHVGSTLAKQSVEDFQSYDALMSCTDRVYDEMMTKNCVRASNLDFPIDAFGSQRSLDMNVTSHGKTTVPSVAAFNNVRRHSDDGTRHVIGENGISDGDSSRSISNSAESVVEALISEMIDRAISSCMNTDSTCLLSSNGLDCEDDTPSEMQSNYCNGVVEYPPGLSNAATRMTACDMSPTLHPLYAHILLYVRKFDTNRAVYALSRLRAIIGTSANVIVRALTTSNVGGTSTPRAVLLQSLLVQHRRSVLGRRFGRDDAESGVSGIRSSMFIDVLVTICLYYVRGYYPNLLAPSPTPIDIADNARLQVSAADILTTVLDELAVITRTGGRGFATYIFDLLDKCKVRALISVL